MQIDTGLFDHMVLQRGSNNRSSAAIIGRCTAEGPVTARILQNGKTLKGWGDKWIGTSRRNRFRAQLNSLPTGGPYDIELRIKNETLHISDVLVGDVWLLAGQSNMTGADRLTRALPPHPQVRAFYMNDQWDVAADPLHTMWCAVDPVHGGNPAADRTPPPRGKDTGVGPGVAFAQALFEKTGVPQGVIACAQGGTSMTQWKPTRRQDGGRSLYGALARRLAKNGGRVAGLFWYQGESDAVQQAVDVYTARSTELIRAVRRDAGDARLPVVVVQIGRTVRDAALGDEAWQAVRERQRLLPRRLRRVAVVPSIDLPLCDSTHLTADAQHVLGARAADAMLHLIAPSQNPPPIDISKPIVLRQNKSNNMSEAVVTFDHVIGHLRSVGRPTGFSLSSCSRAAGVFRVDLAGNTATLQIDAPLESAGGMIAYAAGVDPYANLFDSAGRPVSSFGPLPMQKLQTRALTPYVRHVRMSPVLPYVEVADAGLPRGITLTPRTFAGDFCDRHTELTRPALVYFAFAYRCATPMRLALHVGYDGPVKVFLDGEERFCDPAGTNPANRNGAQIPLKATPGHHEVIVALTSRGGAWGVYLRLERLDVKGKKKRDGQKGVAMPEILG